MGARGCSKFAFNRISVKIWVIIWVKAMFDVTGGGRDGLYRLWEEVKGCRLWEEV